MTPDAIKQALLESYARDGGINHLDGVNLPSQDSVTVIARDLMHVLFPGYFEQSSLSQSDVPAWLDRLLTKLHQNLKSEIEKCLRFGGSKEASKQASQIAQNLLAQLPEIRRIVQTDVTAAYQGDPAARSVEEIIVAYPCVLVISLQRIAHVLYHQKVPLLPRMLTEYGHERAGVDIHPGAQIGSHFFIDHGTGVVIGETARIGHHVKIYQGVTLGAKSFENDADGNPVKGVKRHPDIEDHVTIYPGATILGGRTVIGKNSVIGSHVWLMKSIPADSTVYYQGELLSIVREQNNKAKGSIVTPVTISQDDWVI